VRPAAPSSFVTKSQFAPSAFQTARCYSAASGLQKPEVEGRIVDLLKNFDKVRLSWRVKEKVSQLMSISQVTDTSKVRQDRRCIPFSVETNNLQLTPTSHFANDLGLDSLDTVEVVMAIEEVSVVRGAGIAGF
jgi:NADH dehydrogenase (ubiquinone) 1 alpha/beta subcomplex 1